MGASFGSGHYPGKMKRAVMKERNKNIIQENIFCIKLIVGLIFVRFLFLLIVLYVNI